VTLLQAQNRSISPLFFLTCGLGHVICFAFCLTRQTGRTFIISAMPCPRETIGVRVKSPGSFFNFLKKHSTRAAAAAAAACYLSRHITRKR
jgi:hypothetical protein